MVPPEYNLLDHAPAPSPRLFQRNAVCTLPITGATLLLPGLIYDNIAKVDWLRIFFTLNELSLPSRLKSKLLFSHLVKLQSLTTSRFFTIQLLRRIFALTALNEWRLELHDASRVRTDSRCTPPSIDLAQRRGEKPRQ